MLGEQNTNSAGQHVPAGAPATGGISARATPDPTEPGTSSPPPDLSRFPTGMDPLTPLRRNGPTPDACKVLTSKMVIALMPGADANTQVTTPRSTKGRSGTPATCQYVAVTAGGRGLGSIIVDFLLAPVGMDSSSRSTFADAKQYSRSQQGFRDYAATLGSGSQAFFDGSQREMKALYRSRLFSVSANLLHENYDKVTLLRDHVVVPVVRNIIARMNASS